MSSPQVPDLSMLDMTVLGKSLLVLGLAFFVSGLVFLLPNREELRTRGFQHSDDDDLDRMS